MQKRRRLGDLYVRGKEVTVDDGTGDPIAIWLQKLNELDRDTVVRRANAAKARFQMDADDENSEVFAASYAVVREFDDRSGLVAIVIGDDVQKFRARFESELALDEETWAKDGYLHGLVDAWTGIDDEPGLAAAAAEDPEDPEAKRVLAELTKFEEEVNVAVRAEVQRLEAEWAADEADDETLWRHATKALLRSKANDAFLTEYERQQIFHTVREPDNRAQRYFEIVREVDDLDPAIRQQIVHAYNVLSLSAQEGKALRASQDSSTSSEPSEPTSEPSGPVAANT